MAFEAHCIVEIMGHQVIAGKVSEETHFGSPLMRVDVPKTSKRDSFTVYYGGGAIYKITPTTEEICAAFVEKQEPEPIKPYMLALPTMAEKVVTGRMIEEEDDGYDPIWGRYDDDDDSDFDDDDANEAIVPVTLLIHHDFPRDADSSGNDAAGDGPDDDAPIYDPAKEPAPPSSRYMHARIDADKAAEGDEVKPE